MVLELIMLSETNQTQKENVFFHVRNQSIYQSIYLSIVLSVLSGTGDWTQGLMHT
jgi:hypothetical protein